MEGQPGSGVYPCPSVPKQPVPRQMWVSKKPQVFNYSNIAGFNEVNDSCDPDDDTSSSIILGVMPQKIIMPHDRRFNFLAIASYNNVMRTCYSLRTRYLI